MPKVNLTWGTAFRDLRKQHNLSYRAASIRARGLVSHTAVKQWDDGIVPENPEKVWPLMVTLPKEEVIPVLQAAGLPLPPISWITYIQQVYSDLPISSSWMLEEYKNTKPPPGYKEIERDGVQFCVPEDQELTETQIEEIVDVMQSSQKEEKKKKRA